jgi:hypothetical protein
MERHIETKRHRDRADNKNPEAKPGSLTKSQMNSKF